MIKVDNAIILAAGFGSRFVPVTFSTPKGLIEVRGEPMVERQIRQLLEVGVEEIVIVTGYKGEQFEYLKEKYGVILVNNPEHHSKNNISSIYYAREYLKNSYLLTSDIFMPDNIYSNFEPHSWYALRYFDAFTEEWGCKLDDNGVITSVSKNVESDWAMYGPCFFTQEFSTMLVENTIKIYDDESKAQYYWEDVFMDNLEHMTLYGNKLSDQAVIEFESLDELREFEPKYNVIPAHSSIEEISNVFNVSYDKIHSFFPIDIGMTNKSYKFAVDNITYVYRLAGEGTEVLISRKNEFSVYEKIKSLNIADEIVSFNSVSGSKITRYFEDARMMDKNNWDEIKEGMKIIRSLHNSNIHVDHEFNLIERINHYKSLCDEVKAPYFEGVKEHYDDVMSLGNSIYSSLSEPVLCHIDPAHVNFLYTKNEGLKLLDWEYSGMAYPFLDVAMCGVYHEYNDEDMDKLLNIYLEREAKAEELKVYYTFIALAGYLWTFWTIFKEYSGLDYGSYGNDQFNLSKKYYSKAIKL